MNVIYQKENSVFVDGQLLGVYEDDEQAAYAVEVYSTIRGYKIVDAPTSAKKTKKKEKRVSFKIGGDEDVV